MENLEKNMVVKKIFPKWWDILVMLLLFAFAQLLFGTVLQAVGIVTPTTSALDEVDIETYMSEQSALGRYSAMVHLFSFLFSTGVLWLYARLRGGKRVIRIRHKSSGFNPSIVLMGVLWLMASQLLLEPLLEMLPSDNGHGIGRGMWAAFTAIVSAPILEELLCRGVLFEVLNRRWGVKVSILISALFFGLLHFSPANAIVAIVAGLIFGVLYVHIYIVNQSKEAIISALVLGLRYIGGTSNTVLQPIIPSFFILAVARAKATITDAVNSGLESSLRLYSMICLFSSFSPVLPLLITKPP